MLEALLHLSWSWQTCRRLHQAEGSRAHKQCTGGFRGHTAEPGSAMGASAWPPCHWVGAPGRMRRRAPPHDSAGVGLAWPAGALARQGNGRICLAYVCPSLMHSQCSAPYLLSTPLCTAGPPPPRRNWVTTANFESADQSSMIWASLRTGLQLGWSGCAKKR